MALIDTTYFVGEISIPNINDSIVKTDVEQAIDQYEKEILISLLGYPLYKELIDDLDESGDPQTDKYVDLVNGADFTLEFQGKTFTQHWNGLVNTEKQSLIAYYVYCKYVERDHQHLSGVGSSMIQSENAERVSPALFIERAWSKMLQLYGLVDDRYFANYCFPYYNNRQSLIEKPSYIFNGDASAYNFLASNLDVYDNWLFTVRESVNRFGI